MNPMIECTDKTGKKPIYIILFFVFSLLLYPNVSNTLSLVSFLALIILCCLDDHCLMMSIGCGNVLPSIMGLTMIPVVVFVCLIKGLFRSRFILTISRKMLPLLVTALALCIVLFLSSIVNDDSSLFNSFILNILFMLALTYYFKVSKTEVNDILTGFFMGLGIAIILGVLVQFNISGYESNHIYRLAVGERSDPNSTAFLSTMFLMLLMSNLIIKSASSKMTILYILLLFPSLLVLFATASRGGALAFVIGLLICVFVRVRYNYLKQKTTLTKILSICMLFLIILIVIGNIFAEQWFDAVYSLFDRVGEKNDGGRLALLLQSINLVSKNNPILGIGLENFQKATTHVPHNLFSDYLVGGGWLGLILFLFICVINIKSLTNLIKKTKRIEFVILLSLLIVALIDMATYSAYNEKILYFFFALVAYSACKRKEGA